MAYRKVYLGPFLRVWMPERTAHIPVQSCTNEECKKYGEHNRHQFCGYCGKEVKRISINKPSHLILHDFLNEEFQDPDMFIDVQPDGKEYILVVPNRHKKQGGAFFEDSPDSEILVFSDGIEHFRAEFDREDWIKLVTTLLDRGIKYEQLTGVLQWFA